MALNCVIGSPRSFAAAAAWSSARDAVDARRHVGELELNRLELLDRLTELLVARPRSASRARAPPRAMPIACAAMPSRPLSSDCMA